MKWIKWIQIVATLIISTAAWPRVDYFLILSDILDATWTDVLFIFARWVDTDPEEGLLSLYCSMPASYIPVKGASDQISPPPTFLSSFDELHSGALFLKMSFANVRLRCCCSNRMEEALYMEFSLGTCLINEISEPELTIVPGFFKKFPHSFFFFSNKRNIENI